MLSSSVPRSTSGSTLSYAPSSGTGSPLGMNRPMGGMGMAPPQGPPMNMQRGGANMTFDPFANMTPTNSQQQQQQQYRQSGRR